MRIVIVGAGQAGGWVARSAREGGHTGEIVLLGRESLPPYERPPLSKDVLDGREAHPPEVLTLDQCQALSIDFRPGTEVVAIDRVNATIQCADGTNVDYDRLVLATGGLPRRLGCPGEDLPGVHTLRTVDNARAIAKLLQPDKRLLVVGGGWIGLEIAATARSKHVEVVLAEAGQRLCARSLPSQVSDVLKGWHEAAGVDVRIATTVVALEKGASRPLRAKLSSGVEEFDGVIVGVGLHLETALAENCGLAVQNGVVVDQSGRTSDPQIYAVGDISNQLSSFAGVAGRQRLESWANAQNQGIAVGKTLAGTEVVYDDVPWFWSDQYGKNLQVLGVPTNAADTVIRGTLGGDSFSLYQTANGKLQSVIAVNAARDIKIAKRWMKAGTCPPTSILADCSTRLDRL